MSTLPWEPDRALTIQEARLIIGVSFPSVDSSRLEHIGSGWEFDAFLTPDGWLFRFPRRAEYEELFDRERPVVELVGAALPPGITVPHVELLGQPTDGFPYRFAGHRFIKGVAADSIDPGLLPETARSLALALGAVHSIPENEAREAGLREFDHREEGRVAWLRQNLAVASTLRDRYPVVEGAAAWVAEVLEHVPPFAGPLRVIHHDLSSEHLILNPTTGELVGILDWTDAILGDPARDFVTSVTFGGWNFVEQLLASYPLPVDSTFRARLRFMAQLLSVMWLGDTHQRGGDLEKAAECVGRAFAPSSAS